jgi:hypothetical protein
MFGFANSALAQSIAQSGNYNYYNFAGLQMETIPEFPTAEKMREFIPQTPEEQNLYDLQIQSGKSPMEAVEVVLEGVIATLKSVLPSKNVKVYYRPTYQWETPGINGGK